MGIPIHSAPPDTRTSYIIDQLEGERLTIPGSKGVFRILASSKQTNGGIAVFSSGAVLSDAPGFHWHAEAHDVFLVTKGFLKLWNGNKCRIMGPGDFAYVPPVRQLSFYHVKKLSLTLLRKSSTIPSSSVHTPRLSGWSRQETGLTFSATLPRRTAA
jgi:mannose-6-phosphate isomerase-like protein (cupin superfamily)